MIYISLASLSAIVRQRISKRSASNKLEIHSSVNKIIWNTVKMRCRQQFPGALESERKRASVQIHVYRYIVSAELCFVCVVFLLSNWCTPSAHIGAPPGVCEVACIVCRRPRLVVCFYSHSDAATDTFTAHFKHGPTGKVTGAARQRPTTARARTMPKRNDGEWRVQQTASWRW